VSGIGREVPGGVFSCPSEPAENISDGTFCFSVGSIGDPAVLKFSLFGTKTKKAPPHVRLIDQIGISSPILHK
jgi:hypothetical protein